MAISDKDINIFLKPRLLFQLLGNICKYFSQIWTIAVCYNWYWIEVLSISFMNLSFITLLSSVNNVTFVYNVTFWGVKTNE